MFSSHLKVGLRNLFQNRGYAFLNIVGLALGITVCFLIFLWVQNELSYDSFHEKGDRIYRTLWDARYGDNEWTIPLCPVPLEEALTREFPEVESAVRLLPSRRTLRNRREFVIEPNFLYVEDSFFQVFTVSLISGNLETALSDPNSVVLTEETAQRYFPNRAALGQTLEVNNGDLLKVTAVVKSFPPESHFQFDFLAPLKAVEFIKQRAGQWGSATVYTYLTLRPGEAGVDLETKLRDYVETSIQDESFRKSGNYSRFLLQPLHDIYLGSQLRYELGSTGNIRYVYLFSAIGLFILILACINFINMATARSEKRAREVGLRKVFGSQRLQLMRQFFTESALYVTAAVLLAMLLIEIILPFFNRLVDKQFSTNYLGTPMTLLLLGGIAGIVTLAAGTYPAIVLSGFRPIRVLRGRLISKSGGNWLRNGLVILQFCISISLIIGTLIIQEQLDFLKSKRLGFDKEHVLVIRNARSLGDQYSVFCERLMSTSTVVSASATQSLPGKSFDSTVFQPEQPSNYEETSLTYAMVDEYYVDVLNLKIVEGRNFSKSFATDSTAYLINESAAKALGWKQPVGKRLRMSGDAEGPVVGVLEDFHFQSLHHEVKPIILPFIRWRPAYIAVRLQPGDFSRAVDEISALWHEFKPDQPFQYSFLDSDYDRLYRDEQRMAQFFGVFSIFAIFIACLGLFALAAHTAEQRIKEIGIRKVLGASVPNLVIMLSKEFAKWVMWSNLIAWPVAYWLMHKWLLDFAYSVEMSWWIFVVAGGLALLIALLTVNYQTVRAALANPVESLRYE